MCCSYLATTLPESKHSGLETAPQKILSNFQQTYACFLHTKSETLRLKWNVGLLLVLADSETLALPRLGYGLPIVLNLKYSCYLFLFSGGSKSLGTESKLAMGRRNQKIIILIVG